MKFNTRNSKLKTYYIVRQLKYFIQKIHFYDGNMKSKN